MAASLNIDDPPIRSPHSMIQLLSPLSRGRYQVEEQILKDIAKVPAFQSVDSSGKAQELPYKSPQQRTRSLLEEVSSQSTIPAFPEATSAASTAKTDSTSSEISKKDTHVKTMH